MATFSRLWGGHPGRVDVCDKTTFANQCAMRVSTALRAAGVPLPGLKTCVDYDRKKYRSHAPGHVRAAQDLANHFYRVSGGKGLGAKSFNIWQGSINDNIAKLAPAQGMIFIMNGWGSTDHIDLWQGNGSNGGTLKGGEVTYLGVGAQIWFWAFD